MEICRHSPDRIRKEEIEKEAVEYVLVDLGFKTVNLFAVADEASPRKGEAIAANLQRVIEMRVRDGTRRIDPIN